MKGDLLWEEKGAWWAPQIALLCPPLEALWGALQALRKPKLQTMCLSSDSSNQYEYHPEEGWQQDEKRADLLLSREGPGVELVVETLLPHVNYLR